MYEYACVEEFGNLRSSLISESVKIEPLDDDDMEDIVDIVDDFLNWLIGSGCSIMSLVVGSLENDAKLCVSSSAEDNSAVEVPVAARLKLEVEDTGVEALECFSISV